MKRYLFFTFLFQFLIVTTFSQKHNEDIWLECIVGKPNIQYLHLKDSVCSTMGINYNYYSFGCDLTKEDQFSIKMMDEANNKYFEKLNTSLGKDWLIRFNNEMKKINPTF